MHVCVCVGMYMHVRMLLGTHVQARMPMMISSLLPLLVQSRDQTLVVRLVSESLSLLSPFTSPILLILKLHL